MMINEIRIILIVETNDWLTSVNVAIVEMAIMTIIIGLVIPARIAASPIIIPPTTLIVPPKMLGKRNPASRNSSNIKSIPNISKAEGNGEPVFD